MKLIRKTVAVITIVASCLLLNACGITGSADDLFTLPQLPMAYSELTTELENLIAQGYEYVTPNNGDYLQSVQMNDVDADGEEEAFVLLRKDSDQKPLKILIYKRYKGEYVRFAVIESSGESIDTLYFSDFNGDERSELIVGWKINEEIQNVVVYSISRDPVQLLNTGYTKYSLVSLQDDITRLVVVHSNNEGTMVAELYGWQTDLLTKLAQCKLSSSKAEISQGSMTVGRLSSGETGVFISGVTVSSMVKTDIVAIDEAGGFKNLSVGSADEGTATLFPYRQLLPQDINEDGIMEVPSPCRAYSANGTEIISIDTLVSWYQYGNDENSGTIVEESFHCQSVGWYVLFPDSLHDQVSVNLIESEANETEELFMKDDEKLFAIYTITGENRENKGMIGNRFVIKRQTNTVIAAEIFDQAEAYGIDEIQLRKNFYLSTDTWE